MRNLVGATAPNLVLFVVYTLRDDTIRIVTAYAAEPEQEHEYWQRSLG